MGVYRAITAENQWTDAFVTRAALPPQTTGGSDSGDSSFHVSVWGAFVANVRTQLRPWNKPGTETKSDETDWRDIPNGGFTGPAEKNGNIKGIWEIRIGVPTGNYTSGTVYVAIQGGVGHPDSGNIFGENAAGGGSGDASESTLQSINVKLGALSKAEDAAHASGDSGVLALAVRNDNEAVITSDDLDYSAQAVDDRGRTIVRGVGKDADGAASSDTGSASIIALIKRLLQKATAAWANTTLTSRMLAKQPFDDTYRLWFETGLSTYLYIAENLAAKVATDTDFRGVRIPLDSNGNPSGEVEVNTGFKWSDKSGGTWS